jgi:YHS domain-containing protein
MTQKDPVCDMTVDEKKAQHVSEVNGQKIYLCSAACKSQFDQNSSKYRYRATTLVPSLHSSSHLIGWLTSKSLALVSSLKLSFYRLYSSSIFILVTGHASSATEKSLIICKPKHMKIPCNWSFTKFTI